MIATNALSRPRWSPLPIGLTIALVTFIAFLPALDNQFLMWDDDVNFVNNPHYRGFSVEHLQWMFTSFHSGHYQPIAWLTLAWDAVWGDALLGIDATWGSGLNPRAYHLSSNLFHAVNAALVYLIALRLISWAWFGHGMQRGWMIQSCACTAALLWSVHPMRVENVAWITERRDLVSALLLLLTLLAYLRAIRFERAARWTWIAVSCGFYVLSLLAKVSGVPLVAALIVLDWYPLRRFSDQATRNRRPILIEKIPYFIIALLFAFIAIRGQAHNAWLYPLDTHPLHARIVQMAYGAVFYLAKTVWPVDLLPLYALRRPMDVGEARFVVSIVLALGLAIGAILAFLLKRGSGAVAALAVYAAFLAPVLGLFQNGPQIVADRYSYLPAIGLMILASGAMGWWLRSRSFAAPMRLAAGTLAGVIVLTLGALTWSQTQVWRDSQTMWGYMLEKDDACAVAHDAMGVLMGRERRYDQAIRHFRRAIELDPYFKVYREHLRRALRESNRFAELIEAWVDEAKFGEHTAEYHFAQGVAALRGDNPARAIEHLTVANALRPRHAPTLHNLGVGFERQGNGAAAVAHYRAALQVDPNFIDARYGLAAALARGGEHQEALTHVEALLKIAPDHAKGRALLEILQSRVR